MPTAHEAAAKGDAEGLRAALAGATEEDLARKDKAGRTPLHLAAHGGKVDCIQLLLDKGADVDAEDKQGRSALHLASQVGHLDAVKALLTTSDEDAEDSDGNTPLWLALGNGHLEVVQVLLDSGAAVDVPCDEGLTYLHKAAALGNWPAVKMLLAKGASVKALDAERRTPLLSACVAGAWDIATQLVEAGSDVKATAKDAWTALHFTAQNPAGTVGALDFAELLHSKGASALARTRDGLTPAAVVGQDVGKRSRSQQAAEEDMRSLLQDMEADETS